jgi:hypothetical protein
MHNYNENSEKEKQENESSSFFPFDLNRCGLCLKRSHTVLDTIHTVAAVIQQSALVRAFFTAARIPTVYEVYFAHGHGLFCVFFRLRP